MLQFDHPAQIPRPQFGHVGWIGVPRDGQNTSLSFAGAARSAPYYE